MLEIDSDSLSNAAGEATTLSSRARLAMDAASGATIGSGYSTASGFNQMGSMHGMALKDTPGSAATILRGLSTELSSIKSLLNATSDTFVSHDDTVARAMDIADQGGSVQGSSHSFEAIDASGASALQKTPVGVVPGLSVKKLMLDLQATDGPAAFNSQKVWVDIIRATRDISTGLSDVATHISANNSGDAVDAMVSRLQSTSGRASTISENASVMNTTLGALDETRIRKLGEVTSAMLEINAIKALGPAGAAAARAAEKLFLGYYATTTQTELMGLIPTVVNLTSADRGTTGGTIDSAMNDIDGTGTRYSTDGVITPESLASQVFEAAQAYPESFERINAITRDMAAGAGADIGEGLFSPQGIRTEAATVTTPSTFTGLGATPGAAALGGGLGTGAGAGMPGFSGLAGTGLAGAAGTAGMASGMAGMPLNATQVGTKGTSLTPNLLSAGNTAALSGPLTGPLTSAGTGASMGRGLSGITPTSGSAGIRPGFSNGVTGSTPDADTARRTGLSAGGTGAGSSATGRGGLAPMMGTGAAAGRGAGAGTNAGKRAGQVRTITSQVERDGDQKALLGERSPVVPGVIGDWVRDEPEGR